MIQLSILYYLNDFHLSVKNGSINDKIILNSGKGYTYSIIHTFILYEQNSANV